jgi:hypothetical protein
MIEDIDIATSRHCQSIKYIRSNALVFSKKASLHFATLKRLFPMATSTTCLDGRNFLCGVGL